MNLNSIALQGRLTADPEMRSTPSGKHVISFAIAASRYKKDETDFIDCVAWEKTADFISNYFKKGNLIIVDGRLQTRTYDNKEGKKMKVTEVVVDNAYFCGKAEGAKSADVSAEFEPVPYDDDLPF